VISRNSSGQGGDASWYTGGSSGGDGGGILSTNTLAMTRCLISENFEGHGDVIGRDGGNGGGMPVGKKPTDRPAAARREHSQAPKLRGWLRLVVDDSRAPGFSNRLLTELFHLD
jgi:hypothetical protein